MRSTAQVYVPAQAINALYTRCGKLGNANPVTLLEMPYAGPASYFPTIKLIDDQVGRIVAALEPPDNARIGS